MYKGRGKQPHLPNINIHPYERYLPSAFDNSLSILEKMNKMIEQMNRMGFITNDLIEQWNDLYTWVSGEGLEETVKEIMDKYIDDGTFDSLFDSIVGNLNDLPTENKENIVKSIIELMTLIIKNKDDIETNIINIGNLTELNTINKSSLVNAINEMLIQIKNNSQSPLYSGEATGHGVISGLHVKQQPVLAMAVDVGDDDVPNIVHYKNGVRRELESISVGIEPSETKPRFDVVYVDFDGIIKVRKGQASDTPLVPSLLENEIGLAVIEVKAGDTTINTVDIQDIRKLKSPNSLKTNEKANLVVAINEILELIVKNNNEVTNDLDDISNKIGNLNNLPTTAKENIVNAIIEIVEESATKNDVGDIQNLQTTNKNNVVSAINELVNSTAILDKIGDLNNLPTQEKDTIVESIVEIFDKITIDNRELQLNVKMFGAIGDGDTDDTEAIQTAIDYAIPLCAKLRFPYGNYLITDTLRITGEGFIVLEGDGGAERTTQIILNLDKEMINVTAEYYITIKGLTLVHNGIQGSIVNFESGESHQLLDCTLLNNSLSRAKYMVEFYGANYRIQDCRFDTMAPETYAIRVSKKIGNVNINSYIDSNYFAGTGKGVVVDTLDEIFRVEGLKIRDNVFINTGAEQVTVLSILDLDLSNNMLDQCSNSAIFINPQASLVESVRIADNYIATAKDTENGIGIHLRDIDNSILNINILGNRFNASGYGVVVFDNADAVIIANNYFSGITQSAINVNGAKQIIINSNMFFINNFDLLLSDGLTGDSYIVTSNDFKNKILITRTKDDAFIIKNNIGYVSDSRKTTTFSGNQAGNVFMNIEHGLTGVPNLNKSQLSVNVNQTGCEIGGMWLVSADAQNVIVGVNVVTPKEGAILNASLYSEL